MEYNRVTATILILMSTASAVSMAGGASTGMVSMLLAIAATMATVLGAGLAWTKASPWVVLGLVAAAAASTVLSVMASPPFTVGAVATESVEYVDDGERAPVW